MEQIKFKTKIKNGSIKLPSKYKELENSEVSVSILTKINGGKRKIKIINPYEDITDRKKLTRINKVVGWVKKERDGWEK
ncbi:MAG TPA: hypothetical protein PKA90_14610 [Ignavibacteria bacterium]|nr:hypothetical protein [Ignavibacteria bacterium]HMR41652.1 hypothetical protein [Ignavibacteria bacterium]